MSANVRRSMAATGVFHKPVATRERAEAEAKGWVRLASRIAVPALHGQIAIPGRQLLVYEDVFATGRCELLMGDVIALADREPTVQPRLDRLVDGVCTDLRAAAEETGKSVPLAECVPDLYLDRIRPGGRLDRWYLRRGLPLALPQTDTTLTLRELADFTLTANGRPLTLNVADTIDNLRHALAPDRRRFAGLTQGDPTEPNIADPLCWLDFEFAGRNTVAGEAANLLWYLMALGGWLVPHYQPDVYARTLRLALSPLTARASSTWNCTGAVATLTSGTPGTPAPAALRPSPVPWTAFAGRTAAAWRRSVPFSPCASSASSLPPGSPDTTSCSS
ncbi:hypothetical protein ACIGJO_09605 [Streptomyces sp. NPDC079020]|uniref:hypothetical protein n=1 Tax=Streptomyces sp. NPDC079020 TaxID=3365722 RepID=UPI0037D72C10